ncbi:TetR family transcriptional regulator [Herbidospora sp. NEAU-GS84]|uniref:TetR family transcriptional regulator n=1 Tax=Herbidospora solisilvae TaxID=2696284 RepID=A0A7C9J0R8_9ACTN|nr:TetR/AcrR family transcriptional regulator [Herbidospora solisilvae]NAS20420.1 TetR family transcriptional regulator [Herbidospora solisilvae]
MRQARSEATIRRLLDTALEAFTDDDFTLRAVTSRSGVSTGSLYHHFGSFDGLAAALYSECMDDLLTGLIEAVERAEGTEEGVRAIVRAYLAFARDETARARFIHAAPFVEPHAAAVAARKAPRMDRLTAWFAPRVAAGEIADLPPALIEMLLIGPLAETTRRVLAGAPGLDLDEAAAALPGPIWRSLRAH